MLLEGKNAIVYGGGGAIGAAVAKRFAAEGARVHLTGRTRRTLDRAADEIVAKGGSVEVAQLDALDETAVERYVTGLFDQDGLDVSFNAVGIDNGDQGVPLTQLTADEYCRPIEDYARVNFVTARAAAHRMGAHGAGVILTVSTPMAQTAQPMSGSFGQAFAAVENLCRQLGAEVGADGVRVHCLRLDGIPEAARHLGSHTGRIWNRAAERAGVTMDQLVDAITAGQSIPRPLTVDDVAGVAAFLASDGASAMTATVTNLTGGSVRD